MKPILFNTQMVRALLEGKKTETRRVCRISLLGEEISHKHCDDVIFPEMDFPQNRECANFYGGTFKSLQGSAVPPYKKGDILYVRETWGDYRESTDDGDGCGYVLYRADFPDGAKTYDAGEGHICDLPRWRPSIHMPAEYARIFLRVTDVHVERLQRISTAEMLHEGLNVNSVAALNRFLGKPESDASGFLESFSALWDSCASDEFKYNKNPWVWVITFDKVYDIEKEEASCA